MIVRKKILLGDKDVVSRKIKDFQIEVNLSRTTRDLVPYKFDNTFDLLKQYKRERNNCRNFRIYGIIDSVFIDCDNLVLYVFKDIPQITNSSVNLTTNHITTVQSKPLISQNWEIKNVFNKKRGKFLIELDNFFESDFIYIYFAGISPEYQNLFKRQLVYRYNTINIMGERVVETIPYGTNEAILDADGNIIEVNNDFDFFYNKHWIKETITINKVRKTKWIPDENTAYCVQSGIVIDDPNLFIYPHINAQILPEEYPISPQDPGIQSTIDQLQNSDSSLI